MSAAAVNVVRSPLKPRRVAGRRLVNRLITTGAWIAAAVGIFMMGWIVFTVVVHGIGAWNWAFFTKLPPQGQYSPGHGIANCIVGTILITFGAAIVGLPLGFFGAIYLSEFGRTGRIATAIRAITNIVLGVPSIIAGMFAYGLIVVPSHHYSGFAGSFALMFIMLPVMTRTAEDILNLVPNELRESALAMGVPRWRATLGVIVKAARSGLITGGILAVLRVAGETAPLLFTALSSPYWMSLHGSSSYFGGPTANLTMFIWQQANAPDPGLVRMAWGASLLIIVAVLGVNILTRLLFQRGKEW
jgi:phosphate transport system permease protein